MIRAYWKLIFPNTRYDMSAILNLMFIGGIRFIFVLIGKVIMGFILLFYYYALLLLIWK